MAVWNPWRGCRKYSEGCKFCYIHKGDLKRNIDTNNIIKTKDFFKPIEKLSNGTYKIKSSLVYLCFSSDFFIEEADAWRDECWNMINKSDKNARILDYDWVLDVRNQCINADVNFHFRQCGTHFVKDKKLYTLQVKDLCKQARLADINYKSQR